MLGRLLNLGTYRRGMRTRREGLEAPSLVFREARYVWMVACALGVQIRLARRVMKGITLPRNQVACALGWVETVAGQWSILLEGEIARPLHERS